MLLVRTGSIARLKSEGDIFETAIIFLNVSAFLPHETSDSESCYRNRTFLRPSQESDLICVFKNVRICVVCHTAVFSVVTQRSSGRNVA